MSLRIRLPRPTVHRRLPPQLRKLKEDLNINLIYDWIVNADQYDEKFGAELAAGNLPDVFMVGPNDFEDLASQGGLADLTEAYETYKCDALDNIFNYDGNFLNVGTKDGSLCKTGRGVCRRKTSGFAPLSVSPTATAPRQQKFLRQKDAIANGAREIDMVINIGSS